MTEEDEAYHERLLREQTQWIADTEEELERCELEELELEPEPGEEVVYNSETCHVPRLEEELRELRAELKRLKAHRR